MTAVNYIKRSWQFLVGQKILLVEVFIIFLLADLIHFLLGQTLAIPLTLSIFTILAQIAYAATTLAIVTAAQEGTNNFSWKITDKRKAKEYYQAFYRLILFNLTFVLFLVVLRYILYFGSFAMPFATLLYLICCLLACTFFYCSLFIPYAIVIDKTGFFRPLLLATKHLDKILKK